MSVVLPLGRARCGRGRTGPRRCRSLERRRPVAVGASWSARRTAATLCVQHKIRRRVSRAAEPQRTPGRAGIPPSDPQGSQFASCICHGSHLALCNRLRTRALGKPSTDAEPCPPAPSRPPGVRPARAGEAVGPPHRLGVRIGFQLAVAAAAAAPAAPPLVPLVLTACCCRCALAFASPLKVRLGEPSALLQLLARRILVEACCPGRRAGRHDRLCSGAGGRDGGVDKHLHGRPRRQAPLAAVTMAVQQLANAACTLAPPTVAASAPPPSPAKPTLLRPLPPAEVRDSIPTGWKPVGKVWRVEVAPQQEDGQEAEIPGEGRQGRGGRAGGCMQPSWPAHVAVP